MSKSLLRNTILTLLLFMGSQQIALATHIIGGEMNYQCLGNNEYEVSLTVYRDCFLGVAELDDTAYVAVFDAAGLLVKTLPILLGEIDTIVQVDACLLIPPNICVETTTYVDTFSLEPKPGGYHLAYQRCCRNETILNIIDPLNTGTTYDIVLSDEAMASCNSSPVLNEWPPTFVCVNRPLNFGSVAFDKEGDSLVYRLCTPYDGGISIDNPRPRPAFPPPYDTIVWNSPTYNLDNILGGIPLRIDPRTGTLTGTPNVIGQFVVGICIDEYRGGQLLSTTKRDFQYNVIPCEDVVATFEIPTSQCDNLTVTPENQTGGEPDGYLWKFLNEANELIAIDTQRQPSYTFIDSGHYQIRLIVNPNSVCADSTTHSIFLQPNTLTADFQYDILGCADSLVLQFTDKSENTLGEVDSWLWTLNGTIDQDTSTQQNPKFTLLNSQQLDVSLQINTKNGCFDEKITALTAMIIPDSFSISTFDTLIVCKGDSIELNPIFNPELSYIWSPPDGLNDINAPNPKAFPTQSTTYVVMIRDSGDNCELRKNVFLEVIDFNNDFDFDIDTLECGDSIRLQLIPDPNYDLSEVTLEWEVSNPEGSQFFRNTQPIFIIKTTEVFSIKGTVYDEFGCSKTVEKFVQFNPIEEEIPASFTLCRGDSVALNQEFDSTYTYLWGPTELFSDPTLPNPIIAPNNSRTISVTISNGKGICGIQKSVNITVLNTIESADFDFQISGCTDSIILKITNIHTNPIGFINEVLWELNGDIEQRNSTLLMPTFVLKNSQFISLNLTINPESACPKMVSKTFRANILEEVQLEDNLSICQGESIPLNDISKFPDYVYNWTPAIHLNNPNAINPIASPNQSTTFQLIYSDSSKLCQIEKEITIQVKDTLPNINASIEVACDGRTVTIRPNSTANIQYDFGDNTPPLDTSINGGFNYTYTTAGAYEISLKYTADNVCPDSLSLKLELPEDNISPNFDWNVESCQGNVASLELLDLSKAAFGEISNWEWSLSNGMSANFEAEPVFSIALNESINVQLIITLDNDNSCKDSIQLEIPPLLIEEMIADSIIGCAGIMTELNPVFNQNYSYSWSPKANLSDPNNPNPSVILNNAQEYFVQIRNEFDCILMDSVFTNAAPEIMINAIEIPVLCDTMEVVLFAESAQADQQFWLNEAEDTLGFDPELMVNIDQSQFFTANFIDSYGCEKSREIFVDFQPVRLSYEERQPVCLNESRTLLINNLDPTSNVKFDWTPTQDIISGESTINPTVQPEETTTFSFTAGNEAGCKFSGQIMVDILPLPIVDVLADPTTIFEGESSQLTATEAPDYIYEWSPANSLDDATIFNPIASPIVTTDYNLLVTDEHGCANSESVTVAVREGICDFPYIFVPTGFTPNGDGQNDELFVRGVFIDELTFIVYDRWGDKVFETTNQERGWDGTRNGTELPSGVFGYYLSVICKNGETYTRQGNVTMIR